MSPTSLEGSSLQHEVKKAAQMAARTSAADFQVETVGQGGGLKVEVELALLRVAQGALANVVAHSQANHIQVILGSQR